MVFRLLAAVVGGASGVSIWKRRASINFSSDNICFKYSSLESSTWRTRFVSLFFSCSLHVANIYTLISFSSSVVGYYICMVFFALRSAWFRFELFAEFFASTFFFHLVCCVFFGMFSANKFCMYWDPSYLQIGKSHENSQRGECCYKYARGSRKASSTIRTASLA